MDDEQMVTEQPQVQEEHQAETTSQPVETPELTKAQEEIKNLKTRAEKAERALKQREEAEEPQKPELSPRDAMLLTAEQVSPDDVDEVVKYAQFTGQSVRDAMKDGTLRAILKDRVEKRASAAATNMSGGRQAPSQTPEAILDAASRGQLPQTDEGIEKLAEARLMAKKARNKR